MIEQSVLMIDPEKLRKARGLRSISAVARELGITYQYLWMLERGDRQPSLRVLAKLCNLYGITLKELLSDQKNLKAA